MLEIIGNIFSSVSVIVLAAAVQKQHKNSKHEFREIRCRVTENESQLIEFDKKIRACAEDVKNIRLEITENKERKPLSEEGADGGRWERWICFEDGNAITKSHLEYIAKVALKAVASELPEEKRTHEIMSEIIAKMSKQLDRNEIRL